MSGDVQPRKRRDKRKKRDDLSGDEPKGTAAALGEGDVFMHSYSDHGTGGHWCAKVIFFSLLAVLVTLIGLIILENRGLTDLDASTVQSQYSGVLDGWLEEAPDDDHHDEHTLELNHPDDADEEHDEEHNLDEEDEEEGEEHDDDDDDDGDEEDQEVELEHIEHEPSDVEPISTELPALPEENEEDDDDKATEEQDDDDDNKADEGDDYLEQDDLDDDDDFESYVVEHVSAPSGKPYKEMEDSNEVLPADTLAEEDEYEQRQEELRREEAETTHMWLKLLVGAALLAATQAVVRRASRGPNESDNGEVEDDEPEPEVIDRRMTLIPKEEPTLTALPESTKKEPAMEIVKKTNILIQTTKPTIEDEEEDELEEEIIPINIEKVESKPQANIKELTPEKYLYGDEEEDEVVEVIIAQKGDPKIESEENDDVPDDVELIDEELIDEELIDEEVEEEDEEISDVDDAELLNRLEAKYGRLPDVQQTAQKKDGGNSVEDFWAEEPNDPYWRQQLDEAENLLHQGSLSAAVELVSAPALKSSARARWLLAQALEQLAEQRRDNVILSRCIAAYLELLKMNDRLSDKQLLAATNRTVDRMSFRGNYLGTEPVYRLLIRRFPHEPLYRNNLTIAFLMANRADLAVEVLKETLKLWPDDRVALAHYGFVQKTLHNKLEESIELFQKALEGDTGPAIDARFYYHLGDALLLLGRFEEAHKVHERGAALGMFLSPSQRSLYNVDHLKSKPWWNVDDTPYKRLAQALEKSWKDILKEGEAARELYEKEKEGLRERGEWTQLDIFIRGREVPGRCKRAPVTCSVVRSEVAAIGCRRGQIKFSSMAPGTHVRPHVGPTNCRLRMHLGLSNTNNTFLRVDKETRQWQVGKVLMFDDSFEHEVWHNGTAPRLVLIVDVWHPSLTAHERLTLPSI